MSLSALRRRTTAALTAVLAAPLAIALAPASAQATTTCAKAQLGVYLTGDQAGDWGSVVKSREYADRKIALETGYVNIAGGGRQHVAWAILVAAGTPVSQYDRVRLDVTTDGGSTYVKCNGDYGPGEPTTWFYVPRPNDSAYMFRACGYLPNTYGRSWVCTGWW
ncbi:hypothetical protein FXF51_26555 [Nonomuraea sp. PA05]|uniref:hypothetical protein n=1 Tax=Nonomuraea sp. PA05 TaxID=2604466 RepID=UPI0011D80D34|nr:hypothetical protein [Nonomuraea sp. PA05]TYB62271.1 hypothetical protein FXF51_26555 [Nonomuraea sp. PA05]